MTDKPKSIEEAAQALEDAATEDKRLASRSSMEYLAAAREALLSFHRDALAEVERRAERIEDCGNHDAGRKGSCQSPARAGCVRCLVAAAAVARAERAAAERTVEEARRRVEEVEGWLANIERRTRPDGDMADRAVNEVARRALASQESAATTTREEQPDASCRGGGTDDESKGGP